MKAISSLTIIVGILISLKSFAQDVHFSQFVNTPLLQNPAFAGENGGDFRGIVNFRSQWGSVTSNPYQTIGASFDTPISNNVRKSYFAVGFSVYADQAGASKMLTTLLNGAIAYHLRIDDQNHFSAALQVGFNQKSFDLNDLEFVNQFDGIGHDPTIDPNEPLKNRTEIKPLISGGIAYNWADRDDNTINVGLGFNQYNQPRYYFSTQDDLGLRYNLSFRGRFSRPRSPWSIQPAGFLALQRKATNIVLGSLFNYTITKGSNITSFVKEFSIGFGGYYRVKDAFIPAVQVQWSSFILGLSYDVNTSELSSVSNGNGGFEVSLKYSPQGVGIGSSKRRIRLR